MSIPPAGERAIALAVLANSSIVVGLGSLFLRKASVAAGRVGFTFLAAGRIILPDGGA
jgi:hypothetical protein